MTAHRAHRTRVAFAILTAAFAGGASAATVTLPPIVGSATFIRNNAGQNTQNYGGDGQMILGTTTTTVYRILLSFDLSAVPSDATVTSVSLTMRTQNPDSAGSVSTTFNLNLHEMTTGFTEGTGSGSNVINGPASWLYKGPGNTPWATPGGGGDFNSPAVSSVTKTPLDSAGAVTFGNTTAFGAAAENAAGGTLSLLLKIQDDAENISERRVFFFHSDEATPASLRPTLNVTYEPIPEPAAILLTGVFGLPLLLRRRRTIP